MSLMQKISMAMNNLDGVMGLFGGYTPPVRQTFPSGMPPMPGQVPGQMLIPESQQKKSGVGGSLDLISKIFSMFGG